MCEQEKKIETIGVSSVHEIFDTCLWGPISIFSNKHKKPSYRLSIIAYIWSRRSEGLVDTHL